MKLKEVIFILAIIFLFLTFFIIKYSGFTIQNTSSKVTVDDGIIIIYDEFTGSSTELLYMNDSELEIIENMTLENTNYGKIIFNENVNLTQDVVSNYLNLNNHANISFSRIEINITKLTSLEKPATLYLYDLTFSNPRILRNGEICPSTICIQQSYLGGTLVFNVTNFTIYSAEETPGIVTPPTEGGDVAKKSGFVLDKDLIKVSLKQGETKRELIKITNTGHTILDISIEPESIEKFVAISEDSFSLKSGQTKIINLDFFAKENEIPDAYVGRIFVKGNGITKAINVIIEIKERKPLFDISIDVKTKEVNAGRDIEANINIVNMGDLEKIDVLVYYAIKDFKKNILSFKEESLFIEDEINIKRKLRVPANAPFGAYIFYSKVSYGNISASGADVFMVSEKIKLFNIILIILITILGILIYLLKRKKR